MGKVDSWPDRRRQKLRADGTDSPIRKLPWVSPERVRHGLRRRLLIGSFSDNRMALRADCTPSHAPARVLVRRYSTFSARPSFVMCESISLPSKVTTDFGMREG